MKMADAKQKRNEQLKRWIGSETDLEPPVVKRQKTKVKFDDGAVFLAACSSGDTDEVLKLLHRGADINYANVDGLTALHQVCAPRRRFPDAAGPRRPPTGPASAPGLPSLGAAGDAAAAEGAASRLGGRERTGAGRLPAGGPFRPVAVEVRTGCFRGGGEKGRLGSGPRAVCGHVSGVWGRDVEGCSELVSGRRRQ